MQEDKIEHKATFDEKGNIILKKKFKIILGKKSRAAGARFELKVRKMMEKDGWVIDKWTNNVDLEKNEIVAAKRKFNPYTKILSIGTGFPDFMGFKPSKFNIIGIEVKSRGYLDKKEREKCKFLLEKNIFSKILIAKRGEKRGEIEYIDFRKKEESKNFKENIKNSVI